jgi:hypothetical protein
VRVVDVAPGAKSVIWHDGQPNGIPGTPFVLTDLQSVAKDLWVTAATADPNANTATVYLNRRVNRPTPVAIAVFGTN